MAQEDKIIFCTGGGCTAKLGAGVLSHILEKLPRGEPDPNLLVGYDSRDDAAVYRITDEIALVQTVDFFPPMVDDPYTFGQIAAANALSDVYAMGGEVKTALNLVCFPESMDLNVLGEIMRGGAEKVAEAGGILAGGHSIADTGVKYGLSVTGPVDPRRLTANDTRRQAHPDQGAGRRTHLHRQPGGRGRPRRDGRCGGLHDDPEQVCGGMQPPVRRPRRYRRHRVQLPRPSPRDDGRAAVLPDRRQCRARPARCVAGSGRLSFYRRRSAKPQPHRPLRPVRGSALRHGGDPFRSSDLGRPAAGGRAGGRSSARDRAEEGRPARSHRGRDHSETGHRDIGVLSGI